ncbi:MAG: pilus assembly protein PilP [Pseudomonadota bacterium]
MTRYRGLGLITVLVVTGCSDRSISDLESFVAEVKSRGEAPVEPIPDIRPPETYLYAARAEELRDPFTPAADEEEPEEEEQPIGNGIRPDFNRRKEELEAYSLDTLRMVGTFVREEDEWGLVQNKEGTVYRVKPGNYLGRNHGRIQTIHDDKIELIEIIPDRAGGYVERPAQLGLGL